MVTTAKKVRVRVAQGPGWCAENLPNSWPIESVTYGPNKRVFLGKKGSNAALGQQTFPANRLLERLRWRAQGDDFRTFLGEFVASLPQLQFPAGLNQ